MTKRFLLIGQRDSVLDVLAAHPAADLAGCIAIIGSHLERAARVRGLPTISVKRGEKTAALARLNQQRSTFSSLWGVRGNSRLRACESGCRMHCS